MNQDGELSRAFKHSHNLSINSVASISEPTTPPTSQYVSRHSQMWDPSKIPANLALPSLHAESESHPLPNHTRQFSSDSFSDKENQRPQGSEVAVHRKSLHWKKIDKEYLSSISRTPLSELKDMIMKLAKDQHGCRFLQKRIDEYVVPSPQARLANFAIIFEQIEDNLYELIIDPFGNYLVQKLIDYCDESILNKFMESLSTNLFQISINQHGTRALQKIVDKMSNDYQLSLLMRGLLNYIIELIKDLNGNHVIQKILNKYSPEKCQFIYDAITRDLLVVATHKHGCCVLQKCLNHVNTEQRTEFSKVILEYSNFVRLVNDQFGNYVLQYLISTDSIDVNVKLFENISNYGIRGLCTSKFSSNVIEKLLKNSYDNEFMAQPKSDPSVSTDGVAFSNLKFTMIHHVLNSDLSKIVNDPYGNYVIQTLVDIMIHPQGVYFTESITGERIMLPALGKLLNDDFQSSIDTLQVQIIKKWLCHCDITSSFGKRIQMKINMILSGTSKPYPKAFNKDSWRPAHASPKQRYGYQLKQASVRNSSTGSTSNYHKGGRRYEFHEMNNSMMNLNITRSPMDANNTEMPPSQMTYSAYSRQQYMDFEQPNLHKDAGESLMRDSHKPMFQTNHKKQTQSTQNNFATSSANMTQVARDNTNDVLYSGQQYYVPTSSSILNRPQTGSAYDAQYMRANSQLEQYSHFDFNQINTFGPKSMVVNQKPTVGIEPPQYRPNPLSYNNSTGQGNGYTGFNANNSSPFSQDKTYFSSFG